MGTLANSGDPDEMPHYAAFYLGLHCLLRQNRSSEKEIFLGEIIICDPLIYTMDHPDLTIKVYGNCCNVVKHAMHLPLFSLRAGAARYPWGIRQLRKTRV